MNSPALTLILLLKYHKGKNKLKALSLARKLHAGSLEGKMEKYLKTQEKWIEFMGATCSLIESATYLFVIVETCHSRFPPKIWETHWL